MTKEHSHVKKYLAVFGALLVLTILTVTVSKFHLAIFAAIALAMVIALTKGGLVLAYFMHLIGETKMVYLVLIITVLFFIVMLLIPTLSHMGDYRITL